MRGERGAVFGKGEEGGIIDFPIGGGEISCGDLYEVVIVCNLTSGGGEGNVIILIGIGYSLFIFIVIIILRDEYG